MSTRFHTSVCLLTPLENYSQLMKWGCLLQKPWCLLEAEAEFPWVLSGLCLYYRLCTFTGSKSPSTVVPVILFWSPFSKRDLCACQLQTVASSSAISHLSFL